MMILSDLPSLVTLTLAANLIRHATTGLFSSLSRESVHWTKVDAPCTVRGAGRLCEMASSSSLVWWTSPFLTKLGIQVLGRDAGKPMNLQQKRRTTT